MIFLAAAAAADGHIDTLIPPQTTAGGPAFTLRVIGDEFEPGEYLVWNSTRLDTTYVSVTELRAAVPAELIRTPGPVQVTLAGYNSLPFAVNPPLSIVSTSPLPAGPTGLAYSHRLESAGGTGPYRWEVTAGALPEGLSINGASGLISGTPRANGTSRFTARVTDAATVTATREFSLTIGGSGPGTATPSCDVVPRNMFLAVHHPDNHAAGRHAYPDHSLRVTMSAAGAPLTGLAVTLTSSRPIFPDSTGLPVSSTATATTDSNGNAVFRVNPPAATLSDLTSVTATAQRGADAIRCQGSIAVGLGTMTAIRQRVSTESVAMLRRLRDQFDIDAGRFSEELEAIAEADAGLAGRAVAALERFQPVIGKLLDGEQVQLGAQEVAELDRTMRGIQDRASPELRRAVQQWRSELLGLKRQIHVPRQAVWRPMKTAQPAVLTLAATNRRVSFEAGEGNSFVLRGATHNALLSNGGVAMHGANSGLVTMRLHGHSRWPQPVGDGPLAERSHYMRGDRGNWRLNVPHYSRVRYNGVYPGTDVVFYGDQGQLRYDFLLKPGARPDRIAVSFDGVLAIEPDDRGELELHHRGGVTRLGKPLAYQDRDGKRQIVASRYERRANGAIGFSVGAYDRSLPLVIDPIVAYSSFAGGSQDDAGMAIAVDSRGSAYVAGMTASADFPGMRRVGGGAPQTGNAEVFVTKFSPDGSGVVFTSYLGGDGADMATAIAVDGQGSIYVGGSTTSRNFPVRQPIQASYGGGNFETGGDGFLFKLDPSGSNIVYSTYLGGSGGDSVKGLAVDGEGQVFVAGFTGSSNFPVRNALQASLRGGATAQMDAFVAKLNAAGSALVYSTFLGGTSDDLGAGVAVDSAGNAYVTGLTYSADFPLQSPMQARIGGGADVFVTKLNAAGNALVYSTYLGGEADDFGLGLAVDRSNSVYVTGTTGSVSFPTTGAAQSRFGSTDSLGFDAFAAKFTTSGAGLVYSTFLGGSGMDVGHSITVAPDGSAFVVGETDSPDFPVRTPLRTGGAISDGFLTRLTPNGATFEYSSYLGGQSLDWAAAVAVDGSGNAYVAGASGSPDYPATPGSAQTLLGGRIDAFAMKVISGTMTPQVSVLSAAALASGGAVAPDSIASAFGTGLSPRLEAAASASLPASLAGVELTMRDSRGSVFSPALYFVSAGQINFVTPAAAAPGLASLTVRSSGANVAEGSLRIETVAPALFSANANGSGPPAGFAISADSNGNQVSQPAFACPARPCVPAVLSVSEPLYLVLYGTGIRGRQSLSSVRVQAGGLDIPVSYAGPQSEFPGFDQLNAGPLPPGLAGKGDVSLTLTVDGRTANPVMLRIR